MIHFIDCEVIWMNLWMCQQLMSECNESKVWMSEMNEMSLILKEFDSCYHLSLFKCSENIVDTHNSQNFIFTRFESSREYDSNMVESQNQSSRLVQYKNKRFQSNHSRLRLVDMTVFFLGILWHDWTYEQYLGIKAT